MTVQKQSSRRRGPCTVPKTTHVRLAKPLRITLLRPLPPPLLSSFTMPDPTNAELLAIMTSLHDSLYILLDNKVISPQLFDDLDEKIPRRKPPEVSVLM
jgi:hypothetical protein